MTDTDPNENTDDNNDTPLGTDVEMDLVDARRAPTTTLAGWRSFVNTGTNDLQLLPPDRLAALSEHQRVGYDEQRWPTTPS